MTEHIWTKSSYSGSEGNCVEVARPAGAGHVLVRDTKDHANGPVLAFTPGAWREFTQTIKD